MIQKDYIYSNAKLHYTLVPGNSDTPLVLIHGQCMCGLDYEKVIEKLSENYTLYLIDCFGHGESEKAPGLYRCRIIGDAVADFIRNEIGKPCIVSGHSSGGILAAYVAGVIPELVKGVLLEDPPFFNVQPGEFENTFVYHVFTVYALDCQLDRLEKPRRKNLIDALRGHIVAEAKLIGRYQRDELR